MTTITISETDGTHKHYSTSCVWFHSTCVLHNKYFFLFIAKKYLLREKHINAYVYYTYVAFSKRIIWSHTLYIY